MVKCSTSWCSEEVETAGTDCKRCQHERAKFEMDQRTKYAARNRRAEIREAIIQAATIPNTDKRVREVARLLDTLARAEQESR